jgi:hypothetical protein
MEDPGEWGEFKCAYLTNQDDFINKTDVDLGSDAIPAKYNSIKPTAFRLDEYNSEANSRGMNVIL